MTTFFAILFVLIAINVLLLLFSVNRSAAPKLTKSEPKVAAPSVTKIYPIDLVTSNYKKAI